MTQIGREKNRSFQYAHYIEKLEFQTIGQMRAKINYLCLFKKDLFFKINFEKTMIKCYQDQMLKKMEFISLVVMMTVHFSPLPHPLTGNQSCFIESTVCIPWLQEPPIVL